MKPGSRWLPLLLLVVLAAVPSTAAAQQKEPIVPDTSAFQPPRGTPSPRGAMLRSFLFPGWGQASAHAYFRGGVYFAIQTGSWYMLLKTIANLASAREIQARRRIIATDSILAVAETDAALAQQVKDPRKLQALVDSSATVHPVSVVVASRLRARQDWIAQVVFWTFAGAVDAYVTAQLADFPAHVSTSPKPGGGVEIRFTLPIGKRH